MVNDLSVRTLAAQAEARAATMGGERLFRACCAAAERHRVDVVAVALLTCEALVGIATARALHRFDAAAEKPLWKRRAKSTTPDAPDLLTD